MKITKLLLLLLFCSTFLLPSWTQAAEGDGTGGGGGDVSILGQMHLQGLKMPLDRVME